MANFIQVDNTGNMLLVVNRCERLVLFTGLLLAIHIGCNNDITTLL